MFNKKSVIIIILVTIIMTSALMSIKAKEKIGLLIIGHGSKSKLWNKRFLKIENDVKAEIEKRGINPFKSIRAALMEMSDPSIFKVIKDIENKGVKKIYVLPLFIAPSTHSIYDVPAILGLYFNKKIISDLKQEGVKLVNTEMKLIIGPGLNYGGLLGKIMLDRVKTLSVNPEEEAVVLLSHGSKNFKPVCDEINNKIGNYIMSNTSINKYDYAFVGIGQEFMTSGLKVINRIMNKTKKIIVIGLYVGMGAERMIKRKAIKKWLEELRKKDGNIDIRFSKSGVLPDKRVIAWIASRGLEWVNIDVSDNN